MGVEHIPDQHVNARRDGLAALRQRSQRAVRPSGAVQVRHPVVLIDIFVFNEIAVNIPALLLGDGHGHAIDGQPLSDKIFLHRFFRAFA